MMFAKNEPLITENSLPLINFRVKLPMIANDW